MGLEQTTQRLMTVDAGISASFIAHFRKLCQAHHRARSIFGCDSKWAKWRSAPCVGAPAGSLERRTEPQCSSLHQQCVSNYYEGEPPHRQCEAPHEQLSPSHQQCEALHQLYWHYIGFLALNGDSVSHFAEMSVSKWDMMGRVAPRAPRIGIIRSLPRKAHNGTSESEPHSSVQPRRARSAAPTHLARCTRSAMPHPSKRGTRFAPPLHANLRSRTRLS
jgi:hypothetical protein